MLRNSFLMIFFFLKNTSKDVVGAQSNGKYATFASMVANGCSKRGMKSSAEKIISVQFD